MSESILPNEDDSFRTQFWVKRWEKGKLLPGGRLVGLFLYGQQPEPPPYPLTDESAALFLGKQFRLVNTETAATDSVPVHQGMERWQEWVKL